MGSNHATRSVTGPDAGPGGAGPEGGYWERRLPPDRLARLTRDMHGAIVANAGLPDADDPLLDTVIGEGVDAFLGRPGHPVAAAMRMARLMGRIGAREAAMGRSLDVLDTSLAIARSAAESYLPRLLAAHPMPADRTLAMREDFAIFIDHCR